ncbi:MAG: redoxin domain-containing protein [Cytophagaceae bacterium]|jgi:peroxiredoxin|nr:redoxin domain-containing protein [Cytophagaceae bacterium]
MKSNLLLLWIGVFLLHTTTSFGQSYSGYVIGDPIRDFNLTNVADAGSVQLYQQTEIVVVLFTSNDCAYSRLYENRIKALQQEFSSQNVTFLLINANFQQQHPQENADAMRKHIQNSHWLIPFLADTSGKVARQFGATRLPHAFVLKKMDQQYRLVYKGAIDDNPQSPEEVIHRFLREAILAMVQKKSVKISETRPVGCILKQ